MKHIYNIGRGRSYEDIAEWQKQIEKGLFDDYWDESEKEKRKPN